MRVLFVCTGNVCRSPAAEFLLRQRVDDAALDVWVESAGTRATKGPCAPGTVKALAKKGIDASGHMSRQVDAPMIERSDLVIATDRANLGVLAVDYEVPREQLFILREFVGLGRSVGARQPDQEIDDWLRKVSALRAPGLASSGDDLPDPYGRRDRAHRKVVNEIDDLTANVLRLLWAPSSLGTPKGKG